MRGGGGRQVLFASGIEVKWKGVLYAAVEALHRRHLYCTSMLIQSIKE